MRVRLEISACIFGSFWGAFGLASPKPASPKLHWQSLASPPSLGSPKAQRGGTLRLYLPQFPLTLRQVGPDAHQSFRKVLDDNDLSLLNLHPNTGQWFGELATEWAIESSGKAVHYRLHPKARWSDGTPVTAKDYTYILEFMRSPFLQAPWYNEYYTKTIVAIEEVKVSEGPEEIVVRLADTTPEPLYATNLRPIPRHFYGELKADFVSSFNWKIPPNTGPYQISAIDKGRSLTLRRHPHWWADELTYMQHRFNVDEVVYTYIRDPNLAFEYLKAGAIDALSINSPEQWRAAEDDPMYQKGYLHRLQLDNDMPRGDYALVLNSALPIFQDPKVREAFAYAMAVDKVIHELLQDAYLRLEGISQGYGAYTNPLIKARPFDLQKANALLDSAGWQQRDTDGIRLKASQRLSVPITYSGSHQTPRLLVLASEAKKAGIALTLQPMEPAAAFKSILDKQHSIALMAWGTPYRPEYRSRFHSSLAFKAQSSNISNTANLRLDQLIEEYEHAGNDSVRIAKAHAIQQFVHDDGSYIPLFAVPYYRLAHAPWLQFPEVPGTKSTDDLSVFDHSSGGLFWMDTSIVADVRSAQKRGLPLPIRTRVDHTFSVLSKAAGKAG